MLKKILKKVLLLGVIVGVLLGVTSAVAYTPGPGEFQTVTISEWWNLAGYGTRNFRCEDASQWPTADPSPGYMSITIHGPYDLCGARYWAMDFDKQHAKCYPEPGGSYDYRLYLSDWHVVSNYQQFVMLGYCQWPMNESPGALFPTNPNARCNRVMSGDNGCIYSWRSSDGRLDTPGAAYRDNNWYRRILPTTLSNFCAGSPTYDWTRQVRHATLIHIHARENPTVYLKVRVTEQPPAPSGPNWRDYWYLFDDWYFVRGTGITYIEAYHSIGHKRVVCYIY